ncbi:MAG TPA: serine hydroxymethyltransferase, partial [SAR324 cluster bacterium]|nr:serine hydroxymethyltransferase [SAR324 cluster bacterium]
MNNHLHPGYFKEGLASIDPEVHQALIEEEQRQQDGIELIASENIVSRATLEALGKAIINKTVEGYPGARYYGGAQHADRIEILAIERAKQLFKCCYANVQPHSGSQANLAVFMAFLKPRETVLSMD